MNIITKRHTCALGELLLGSYGEKLCLCDWEDGWHYGETALRLKRQLKCDFIDGTSPVIEQAICQLEEYCNGERKEFNVPLLTVGTDFQKSVWQALTEIPYGTTISYAEEARRIGRPKSFRAVANANGQNAIAIFIPCHRVIGRNGSLTGYGGGIERKQQLLDIEKPGD